MTAASFLSDLRATVSGWRLRHLDGRAESPWSPYTGSWCRVDGEDPAGLPDRWRRVPGRWWQHGQPMHGLYARPAADPQLSDQVDGMAVLHGWRCGVWRGPAAMADWSSPLVSSWNPVLAQGHGRLGPRSRLDHDEYCVEAVLGGWKPYAYLGCSRRRAWELAARAADTPFGVAVSRYRRGGVALARTETLGELFPDLGGLIRAYHRVLPTEVFEEEAQPLGSVTDWRPADFLHAFAELEAGPLPLLGLMLGYPPLVTAGALLRDIPGWWAECGSLPPQGWRPTMPADNNAVLPVRRDRADVAGGADDAPDPDGQTRQPLWSRTGSPAHTVVAQSDLEKGSDMSAGQTAPAVQRGRWYPQMPPMLDGEDIDRYTNRLTGVYGEDQVPYDHRRNRQCSIGWHMECSDPTGERCTCPCHTDGRVERSWTGIEVDPFEAYCTRCRWIGAASDAIDAICKANAHECPHHSDNVLDHI